MNIEGLSEMTIEKLIEAGMVKELADLFHVEKFKDGSGFSTCRYNERMEIKMRRQLLQRVKPR